MVVRTRRSKAVDTDEVDQTVNHVDVAVTSQADVELAKQFREKFLTRRRDPVAILGRVVRKIFAQIEVHTGAYMFDTREHVIFYVMFALILYLLCSSLVHVGRDVIVWVTKSM